MDTLRFGSFVSFKVIHKGKRKRQKNPDSNIENKLRVTRGEMGGWQVQTDDGDEEYTWDEH